MTKGNAENFLTLKKDATIYNVPACLQADVESCIKAFVNIDILLSADSIHLPFGTALNIVKRDEASAVFQVK